MYSGEHVRRNANPGMFIPYPVSFWEDAVRDALMPIESAKKKAAFANDGIVSSLCALAAAPLEDCLRSRS